MREFLREKRDELTAVFGSMGEGWEMHHCWPSVKAARSRNLQIDRHRSHIFQEHTVDAFGLVAVIGWLAVSHRLTKKKTELHDVLYAFLAETLTDDFDARSKALDIASALAVGCSSPPLIDGHCFCTAPLVMAFRRAEGARSVDAGTHVVLSVMKVHTSCAVGARLKRAVMLVIAKHIERNVSDGAMGFGVDQGVVFQRLAPRFRKRARVDEQFKTYVASEVARSKTAKNGSQLLRGHADDFSPSLARAWAERELSAIRVAAPREFKGSLVIGVCEDGARLGSPPEETVYYCWWSACKNIGTVGVPQVRRAFKNGSSLVTHFLVGKGVKDLVSFGSIIIVIS